MRCPLLHDFGEPSRRARLVLPLAAHAGSGNLVPRKLSCAALNTPNTRQLAETFGGQPLTAVWPAEPTLANAGQHAAFYCHKRPDPGNKRAHSDNPAAGKTLTCVEPAPDARSACAPVARNSEFPLRLAGQALRAASVSCPRFFRHPHFAPNTIRRRNLAAAIANSSPRSQVSQLFGDLFRTFRGDSKSLSNKRAMTYVV